MKRSIDKPLVLPRINGVDDDTIVEANFELALDNDGEVILTCNGETVLGFTRELGEDGRLAMWMRWRKTDNICFILDDGGRVLISEGAGRDREETRPERDPERVPEPFCTGCGDPECGCCDCEECREQRESEYCEDCGYIFCECDRTVL